ncbi:MAG: FKBP-type peptidyl-prolyl cis-trans isomerase [Thalassotalea sp.]
MKIEENKVAVIHYAVSDSDGTLIDSSYDHAPLSVIYGSGYLIPGLESALKGHQAGDKFEAQVPADDAYGQRNDSFVQQVPKEMFGDLEELEVGTQFRAETDHGEQTVIIVDISEDAVTVDGNHPLSGLDLVFDVEVLEVRDATEDELAHGHVHGEGGCGHNH